MQNRKRKFAGIKKPPVFDGRLRAATQAPEKSTLLRGDVERQRVNLMEEVDVLHEHMIRHSDAGGRVVENTLDAGIHKLGGRALRTFRRNGDDAYLDAEFGHLFHERLGAVDFQTVELLTDLDLTLALMGYCELSAKSELIGMEVLFSMEPQKRLEILFSVLLLSDGTVDLNGRICSENRSAALGETYAKLPYTLPREAMRSVLYLSKSSFDRLLCDWSHSKGFVRDAEGDMWVDVERLTNALKWIREH